MGRVVFRSLKKKRRDGRWLTISDTPSVPKDTGLLSRAALIFTGVLFSLMHFPSFRPAGRAKIGFHTWSVLGLLDLHETGRFETIGHSAV